MGAFRRKAEHTNEEDPAAGQAGGRTGKRKTDGEGSALRDLVRVIRLDRFIRFGVQQHPGYLMRLIAEFCISVLHIGENLIML